MEEEWLVGGGKGCPMRKKGWKSGERRGGKERRSRHTARKLRRERKVVELVRRRWKPTAFEWFLVLRPDCRTNVSSLSMGHSCFPSVWKATTTPTSLCWLASTRAAGFKVAKCYAFSILCALLHIHSIRASVTTSRTGFNKNVLIKIKASAIVIMAVYKIYQKSTYNETK